MTLNELDIPPMGGRRYCNHKVINIGENQASGNGWVEGGNVDDKQKRGDGGTLWGTHGIWRIFFGEPWKRRRHFGLVRKLLTHETTYLCAPLPLSAAVSWDRSTLSKPPLMSRKREETLRSSR